MFCQTLYSYNSITFYFTCYHSHKRTVPLLIRLRIFFPRMFNIFKLLQSLTCKWLLQTAKQLKTWKWQVPENKPKVEEFRSLSFMYTLVRRKLCVVSGIFSSSPSFLRVNAHWSLKRSLTIPNEKEIKIKWILSNMKKSWKIELKSRSRLLHWVYRWRYSFGLSSSNVLCIVKKLIFLCVIEKRQTSKNTKIENCFS